MTPDSAPAASIAAKPLATIGLALSGGGFRAAAFSLGCLAYLDHCTIDADETGLAQTLLDRVRIVASASGGSLPALVYAVCRYSGQSFAVCYQALRGFMTGDTLFRQVFDALESDKDWKNTTGKQRNLINAFSLSYQGLFDKLLTDRPNQLATLGLFSQPNANLPRICVNATEFQAGLTFRFQNVGGAGLIGNFGLYLDPKKPAVAGKLRLGDIMAASSCFPSGLEPIMFPRDFAYTTEETVSSLTTQDLSDALVTQNPLEQARKIRDNATTTDLRPTSQEQLDLYDTDLSNPTPSRKRTEFGLMDGGIDDNQSLGSLLLADARQPKRQRFGTLIACDVNSPYMSPFRVPQVKTGLLGNRSLRFWGWTLAALGAGLLAWGVRDWKNGPDQAAVGPVLATLGTLLLLADLGIILLIVWWLRSLNETKNTWHWAVKQYIGYFFTIPLSSLLQMLDARLRSVVILAGDVYMKQIRRMHYDTFYNDDLYQHRRMAAMLHTLAKDTYTAPGGTSTTAKGTARYIKKYDLGPSTVMQNVANEARKMDTTLWFDPAETDRNVRDKLIATGQFTLCYNLILYLCRLETAGLLTPALTDLRTRMLTDWNRFQEDPNWLADDMNR